MTLNDHEVNTVNLTSSEGPVAMRQMVLHEMQRQVIFEERLSGLSNLFPLH